MLWYLVDNAHDGRAGLHGLDLLTLGATGAQQQLIAAAVVEVEASVERVLHGEGVSEGVLRAAEVGHSLSLSWARELFGKISFPFKQEGASLGPGSA